MQDVEKDLEKDVSKMTKDELVKIAQKALQQKAKQSVRQKKYRQDKVTAGYKRLVMYVPANLLTECKKLVNDHVKQNTK